MAETPATPTAIKNLELIIEGDGYSKHVNDVNFTKSGNNVTWHGGTPDAAYSDALAGEYLCNLVVVHDYQNEDSLYNFLIDHEGEKATIAYRPDAEGAFLVGAEITLVAPPLGHKYGQFGESTVACPSNMPVRTFADPA